LRQQQLQHSHRLNGDQGMYNSLPSPQVAPSSAGSSIGAPHSSAPFDTNERIRSPQFLPTKQRESYLNHSSPVSKSIITLYEIEHERLHERCAAAENALAKSNEALDRLNDLVVSSDSSAELTMNTSVSHLLDFTKQLMTCTTDEQVEECVATLLAPLLGAISTKILSGSEIPAAVLKGFGGNLFSSSIEPGQEVNLEDTEDAKQRQDANLTSYMSVDNGGQLAVLEIIRTPSKFHDGLDVAAAMCGHLSVAMTNGTDREGTMGS
jgi:hypothetical protein